MVRTKRCITPDGKYSPDTDIREQRCVGCGKSVIVECRLKSVAVYNPITMREVFVQRDAYDLEWLDAEQSIKPQGRLFNE